MKIRTSSLHFAVMMAALATLMMLASACTSIKPPNGKDDGTSIKPPNKTDPKDMTTEPSKHQRHHHHVHHRMAKPESSAPAPVSAPPPATITHPGG